MIFSKTIVLIKTQKIVYDLRTCLQSGILSNVCRNCLMDISLGTDKKTGKAMEDIKRLLVLDSVILGVKVYSVVSCSVIQSSVHDICSV